MARRDNHLISTELQSRDRFFDVGRIYMAKVKDVRNITRAGEIRVWIYSSNIPEEDESRWVVASYAPSLFGTTPYAKNTNQDFENAITSFGTWFPMAHIDNDVFIFFPCTTAENINAYWFACPVNSDTNSMVPGIPTNFILDDKSPTCEFNDKNEDSKAVLRGSSQATKETERPIYSPLNNALEKQGLKKDLLRGISTAGTKRDVPSNVFGILTPQGNSFIMDDGWSSSDNNTTWNMEGNSVYKDNGSIKYKQEEENVRNNAGFRFRTRNGTQLLISDSGTIYMINKDGTAWVELSDDGFVDVYSDKGVNVASNGDINLHSKKKVIIQGDGGIALKSDKQVSIEALGSVNISSPYINTDSVVSIPTIYSKVGSIGTLNVPSIQASGTFKGTLEGTATYATNSGQIPTKQPEPNTSDPKLNKPTTEPIKDIDAQYGQDKIKTINTRVPTHEPYALHNQIDTQLEMNGVVLDTTVKQPTTETTQQQTETPTITNTIGVK